MTLSDRRYSDSALVGQPIPADLDPALLLNELRALRPLMELLHALEPALLAMRDLGLSPLRVQQFADALEGYRVTLARLDTAAGKMDRLDEVIQLLDELEVIVRRQ